MHEQSGEANVIKIYVLTYGNKNNSVAFPNQSLKDNLLDYFNRYKMFTDWLEIENGEIIPVDFSGSVKIFKGYKISDVIQNIYNALENFFDIELRDMGQAINISDIYALIDNLNGVDSVEIDSPAKTLTPKNNQFFILGSVHFNGSYT